VHLSIRNKLFGGFFLVVALTAVLGAFSVVKMGSINTKTVYLCENAVPTMVQIGELKNSARKLRGDQLQPATAPDTEAFKGTSPTSPPLRRS
jgi:hypothetical protein